MGLSPSRSGKLFLFIAARSAIGFLELVTGLPVGIYQRLVFLRRRSSVLGVWFPRREGLERQQERQSDTARGRSRINGQRKTRHDKCSTFSVY